MGEFGGKELVRDQSGVIAHAAAAVVPHLVTAAAPRDLRVDPCEEKSKEMSLTVCDKGTLLVALVGLYLVNMTVAIFYSGNEAAKFAEICAFT